MVKINFRNKGQPAINDTNLNQMQDNIEKDINSKNATLNERIDGTVLYDNSEGIFTGTGTIKDSISNYNKILVEVQGGSIFSSFVFLNPNNRNFNCIMDVETEGKWFVPSSIIFKIVEKAVTIVKNVTLTINSTEQTLGANNGYYKPRIVKIIGYK